MIDPNNEDVSPQVHVILEGSLRRDDRGTILDAHSSVTLVVAGEYRILVDTGAPGDENVIVSGLSGLGICVDGITHVINTHAHHDHVGCDMVFRKATAFLHPEEVRTLGEYWDAGDLATHIHPLTVPCDIAPGVKVMHTPGHTRGSISVIITGCCGMYSGTVVCAGDALPTRDNFVFRLPPGINYDRQLALRSMDSIIAVADWIIPGHDAPFRVPTRG